MFGKSKTLKGLRNLDLFLRELGTTVLSLSVVNTKVRVIFVQIRIIITGCPLHASPCATSPPRFCGKSRT